MSSICKNPGTSLCQNRLLSCCLSQPKVINVSLFWANPVICPSLLKPSLSAQIASTFTSHLTPSSRCAHTAVRVSRQAYIRIQLPTHTEQSREGLRTPNTSLCAVRDPVAGKWPNACARMGVGLELFKAVHVCLSRLKHHIHYPPPPLLFPFFHRTRRMHRRGSAKQACRPLLQASIHLYNSVIGGEGAPSGPGGYCTHCPRRACVCVRAFVSLSCREGKDITVSHLFSH